MKFLLIYFSFLIIVSCGGGGSAPIVISVPTQTLISFNTDVASNSFISQLVSIAEDKKVSIDEAYEAFQWISNNPNFDPSAFANVNIVIDGQSMTLEDGYYALKGFKARYYDGKESLWSMAAKQGKFDDESNEYVAMQELVQYDSGLNKTEKLNSYKDQGKNKVVVIKKSITESKSTTYDIAKPVITTKTTQRLETVENDNGSTTVNTYEITSTTTVVTTTASITVTPITTYTWSNNTTSEELGNPVTTTDSADETTTTVEEVLISSETSKYITDTYIVNIEEQLIELGDTIVTTEVTTRIETNTSDDGVTTNTYEVTTTTTKIPTYTTTTLTPKTVTVWSNGEETYSLGDPVTEIITSWDISNSSSETLIATQIEPLGQSFVTAEYEKTALSQINASYAYARGWTGDGVIVGMVDTGIDTDHEDFDPERFSTINFKFAGTEDDNGHGTHVAGIIAASKNDIGTHGVAYDANLISIKLCFKNGNCSASYFDDAMVELSNQGATVANLSANLYTQTYDQVGDQSVFYLTGQPSFDGVADDTLLNYKTAVDNGMIIVNSAGNRGRAYPDKPSHYATRVDENGNLYLNGQWLIVGAVGSNNEITSWSNRAGHICSNVTYTNGIASGCDDEYLIRDFFVVAPGSSIYSTAITGGTMPLSGTSMAAPYVTGSIAVLKQAWPQLEPEQLVGLITSTALDLGDPGVDDVYGHGLVDLNEATKPQGDIVAVQPSGSIRVVSGGIVGDSSLSALDNISEISSIVVMDSFNRDYYIDDDNFTEFKLVEKSLSNQFANFEPQQTLFEGDTRFSMSESGDDWQYESIQNHKDKLDLTYRFGHLNQNSALLGSSFDGLFSIDSSTTNYLGADLSYKINDHWSLLGSYTRGYSKVKPSNNSFITGSSNIQSQAWYLGAALIRENDSFKIQIGEQLSVLGGSINYNIPTSYEWSTNTTQFTSLASSVKSSNSPVVIEMNYSKELFNDCNMNTGTRYTYLDDSSILSMNISFTLNF